MAAQKTAALKRFEPEPFELIGGDPALDLVNTLDNRFSQTGPVELLATYEDLLRFVAQSELINDRQFRKLKKLCPTESEKSAALSAVIQLREALAAITYGILEQQEISSSALADLETIFNQSTARRKLTPTGAEPALTWQFKGIGKDFQSPIWLLAQAANDLLTSPKTSPIRKCANPTCKWLFLDTSKNHTRRWCDMKICGNRNKARLFHLRQASL